MGGGRGEGAGVGVVGEGNVGLRFGVVVCGEVDVDEHFHEYGKVLGVDLLHEIVFEHILRDDTAEKLEVFFAAAFAETDVESELFVEEGEFVWVEFGVDDDFELLFVFGT